MLEIKGLDELNRALQAIPQKMLQELTKAVDKSGDVILKRASAKAPGRLKSGMELKKAVTSGGKISGTIQFKRGSVYGVFVELGHGLVAWGNPTDKHIPERPFLRPAADESADEVEKIIDAAVGQALKEFSG